jgi:hypothetical protein
LQSDWLTLPPPRRPELKSSMAYAQAHPEEINKVAKVQNQVCRA